MFVLRDEGFFVPQKCVGQQTKEREMSYIDYRFAQKDDVDAIVALIQEHGDNNVLAERRETILAVVNAGLMLVCIDGKKIVGCQGVRLWPQPNALEFGPKVVRRDYRGQTIGTNLSAMILEHCKTSFPNTRLFAFASGDSKGIWRRLGLVEARDVPSEMFGACATCSKWSREQGVCCALILEYVG